MVACSYQSLCLYVCITCKKKVVSGVCTNGEGRFKQNVDKIRQGEGITPLCGRPQCNINSRKLAGLFQQSVFVTLSVRR